MRRRGRTAWKRKTKLDLGRPGLVGREKSIITGNDLKDQKEGIQWRREEWEIVAS